MRLTVLFALGLFGLAACNTTSPTYNEEAMEPTLEGTDEATEGAEGAAEAAAEEAEEAAS